MAKKKDPEPEGHKMPAGIVEDIEPSEDKTKVREIADDDGNLLSEDELTKGDYEDPTGAGSGDPSVDHPEPVRGSAGAKQKYETKSVVEENKEPPKPDENIDDELSGEDDEDDELSDPDDDEGEDPDADDEDDLPETTPRR